MARFPGLPSCRVQSRAASDLRSTKRRQICLVIRGRDAFGRRSASEGRSPGRTPEPRARSLVAQVLRMAASGDGGELHGMYERKLRALTLAAAAKRVLDPKLDTTWERYITVYLSHRDAVATDLACLVSSYDQEAPL